MVFHLVICLNHYRRLKPIIINTKDHGIPQNRERLFIVGIKKCVAKESFCIPSKKPMQPLTNFMLSTRVSNILPRANAQKVIDNSGLSLADNNVIACAGYGNYMKDLCPTITCSTPLYLTKYKRYLTPKELLLLQGFPKSFIQVVSNHQLRKQVGNSMSVNVLKDIFDQIFKTTNV